MGVISNLGSACAFDSIISKVMFHYDIGIIGRRVSVISIVESDCAFDTMFSKV